MGGKYRIEHKSQPVKIMDNIRVIHAGVYIIGKISKDSELTNPFGVTIEDPYLILKSHRSGIVDGEWLAKLPGDPKTYHFQGPYGEYDPDENTKILYRTKVIDIV